MNRAELIDLRAKILAKPRQSAGNLLTLREIDHLLQCETEEDLKRLQRWIDEDRENRDRATL